MKYLFNMFITGRSEGIFKKQDPYSHLCGEYFSVRKDGRISKRFRKKLDIYPAELDRNFPDSASGGWHLEFKEPPLVSGPNLSIPKLDLDLTQERKLYVAPLINKGTRGTGLWLKLNFSEMKKYETRTNS